MLRRRIVDVAAVLGAMALFASTTMAATITVDDDGPADYSSISEAVEAASPGDTVLVRAGTYYEDATITINKEMVLQGAGADSTIVNVVSDRNSVPVNHGFMSIRGVDDVKIDGFTFSFPNPYSAAPILAIVNCRPTITNNKFIGDEAGSGIHMWFDYYDPEEGLGTINGNTITGNFCGIEIRMNGCNMPWPLPAWDFRWNWWGTTDESEILARFSPQPFKDFVYEYNPWLTAPVTTYEETPGIHYNNIYENYGRWGGDINIAIVFWVGVEDSSWGEIKSQYK